MDPNDMAFDAASAWAHAFFESAKRPGPFFEDMMRATVAETAQGFMRAAGGFGLPAGARLEIEVSVRQRRTSFG